MLLERTVARTFSCTVLFSKLSIQLLHSTSHKPNTPSPLGACLKRMTVNFDWSVLSKVSGPYVVPNRRYIADANYDTSSVSSGPSGVVSLMAHTRRSVCSKVMFRWERLSNKLANLFIGAIWPPFTRRPADG